MMHYRVEYTFGDDLRIHERNVMIDGWDNTNPRRTTFMHIPRILAVARTGRADDERKVTVVSLQYLG